MASDPPRHIIPFPTSNKHPPPTNISLSFPQSHKKPSHALSTLQSLPNLTPPNNRWRSYLADHYTPWHMETALPKLKGRFDRILFVPTLDCHLAMLQPSGASLCKDKHRRKSTLISSEEKKTDSLWC